jgi:hypothetical protein
MNLIYRSNNVPVVLKLTFRAINPVKIFIKAEDCLRPNTKFTDRYATIHGTEDILIKMPISPEVCKITIKNDKGNDYGFKLLSKEAKEVKTKMSVFDFGNAQIAKFIIFALQFGQRAGYMSPGEYYNKTGEYVISYLPQIVSHETGAVLNTPARISASMGLVEVSKEKFDKFTIPGRIAILLHEFCHVFANKDVQSETEADKNAATIYLALGFPTIDLLNVFADIFYKADTPLNRKRMDLLIKYAMDFENNIFNVKYN